MSESKLVWGAKAIGQEIRRSERATYNLLENGLLPARKIGGKWVSDANRLHELASEIPAEQTAE